MRILAIVPSIRPYSLEVMMRSFTDTRSEHTSIRISYESKSITKIFNEAFESNPHYDFYFMGNDDCVFSSPSWDVSLAAKGKISYGADGIQNANLCTFPMIDGDIVRALGWLQYPKLEKYCGDLVWKFIGKECGILNYCADVHIEHKWEGCSHPDVHTTDMAEFAKWLMVSQRDINKVRSVLNVGR